MGVGAPARGPKRDGRETATYAMPERAEEVRTLARWLSLGSLVPVVGWLHGVALLWSDAELGKRVKVVGTVLFPGGWFGAAAAAWLITRESSGYCYSTSYGTQDGPELAATAGCAQTGAIPPWLGIVLLVVVLGAAALGPAYVRRSGLRQAAG